MNNTHKTMYRVVYKYRIQKRFPTDRWRPRYRWMYETILVTCQQQYQVEELLLKHLNQLKKDQNTMEMKILEISKVSSINRMEV